MQLGFPGGSSGKESDCQCRRRKRCRFDPWVRKIPGGGHGNPLQISFLENPMDRGAWRPTVHRLQRVGQLKQLSRHTCIISITYLLLEQLPLWSWFSAE